MSKLQDLKTKASTSLAVASGDVRTYVQELESAAGANRNWLLGVGVVCFLIGAFIGHALA